MQKVFYRYMPTMRNNKSAVLYLKTEADEFTEIEVFREAMSFRDLCLKMGEKLAETIDLSDTLLMYWGDSCESFANINKLHAVNIKEIYVATSIYHNHTRLCNILGIGEMSAECKDQDYILRTEALLHAAIYLDPEYLYTVDPTRLVDYYYRDRYKSLFDRMIDAEVIDSEFIDFLNSVPSIFERANKTIRFTEWYKTKLNQLIKRTDIALINEDSLLYSAITKYQESGKIMMIQVTLEASHYKNDPIIYLLRERAKEHFAVSRIVSAKQRHARSQMTTKFRTISRDYTPLVEV